VTNSDGLDHDVADPMADGSQGDHGRRRRPRQRRPPATSSYNFIEQMIQREAKTISALDGPHRFSVSGLKRSQ